jgi:hypothetical protein
MASSSSAAAQLPAKKQRKKKADPDAPVPEKQEGVSEEYSAAG